jgi:hypothetical protein
VAEHVEIEVSAELAVHAGQQVEIEARGHAGGIVVGGARLVFEVEESNGCE